MNWAYLHLVLNHVPIVGFPFALVLFAAGAALRKPDVERAGLVAVSYTHLTLPTILRV